METTEDQRRNLEVDSIDRTQPVQFHQGWRYVVRPPEIEDCIHHFTPHRLWIVLAVGLKKMVIW